MALHEYEQLLMQITFKFDPEDSQFSHPAIVRRSVLPYPRSHFDINFGNISYSKEKKSSSSPPF